MPGTAGFDLLGEVETRLDLRANVDTTRNTVEQPSRLHPEAGDELHPALVLAWSRHEPGRAGDVAVFPPEAGPRVLGRGTDADPGRERVRFFHQRPGSWQAAGALGGSRLSRQQATVEAHGGQLSIENRGKLALFVNGGRTDASTLEPGDTVRLEDEVLFVCVKRPVRLPRLRALPREVIQGFGSPDTFGLVGESPTAWDLRDRIATAASSKHHVLVTGPSGCGKEHTARALHELGGNRRAWVTFNCALSSPESSEFDLFGNAKDYPSPGTPERSGLFGEAHHSTLFLDQIQKLHETAQGQLLRVLDREGTYQRPGESAPRRSTVRIVAALTLPDTLLPDFAERFVARIAVPGLEARREDVPLLIVTLTRRAAKDSPGIARRFFEDERLLAPRVEPRLVEALLRHEYRHHVRELERLVWTAMTSATSDVLDVTDELEEELSAQATLGEPDEPLSPERIREALVRFRGNQSQAARSLGLKNRYALIRLLKRHEIDPSEFRS